MIPTDKKDLLFFEWTVIDHCNLNCAYCVNKGAFSHKKPEQISYTPGVEKDIAGRIIQISDLGGKVIVNLTGGEPLLAEYIREVISILSSKQHIKINLITNFILIEKIADVLSDIESILVSLHIHYRSGKDITDLINTINHIKTKVPLRLSQVNYGLSDADRHKLSDISSETGLEIDFQTFIPPWTEEGRIENRQEIMNTHFVSSFGKRCSLGYFYYQLLPDGKFHHGLWCDKKTRKISDFLSPLQEIRGVFSSQGMSKCRASSCGCNYNTFNYDDYLTACKNLEYPEDEIFAKQYVKCK